MFMKWSLALCLVIGLSVSSARASVLLVGADVSDRLGLVQATISAAAASAGHSLGSIDLLDARFGTPTLATLQSYAAVMVWSSAGFSDGTALGNRLADYVDGGGGVLSMAFGNSGVGALGLYGRWAAGGYDPLVGGGLVTSGPGLSLGTRFVPAHPLFNGVTSFYGGDAGYRAVGTLRSGATLLANYSDGTSPLAMEAEGFVGKVLNLNFFPASSAYFGSSLFWDVRTDGGRLMANALDYLVTPKVVPTSAVPEPGTIVLGGIGILTALGARFARRRPTQ